MPNKSLDASGGSVFLNLLGGAKGALIRAAASTQTLSPLLSLRLDCHFVIVMLVTPTNLRIAFFDGDYSVPLAAALTRGNDATTDLPPTFFREIKSRVRRQRVRRTAQSIYPRIRYVDGTGAHQTGFPIGGKPFATGGMNHFYATKH